MTSMRCSRSTRSAAFSPTRWSAIRASNSRSNFWSIMPSMARSARRCAKLPNLGLRPFRLGLLRAVRRPDAVPHDPQHLPYHFPVIGLWREPLMPGEQPSHALLEHRELDAGLVVAVVPSPSFPHQPAHPT